MSLSDIVGNLGLTLFPIVGMLLFLSVFVGVLVRVTRAEHRRELDEASRLPFDDDPAPHCPPQEKTP